MTTLNTVTNNLVATDVVNVNMDFFNNTPSRSDVVVTPAIIKHVINFSDDVNKSKYASLLKQSFYLKQYFEHFYDENGKENTLKRFLGKVKVTITPTSVTFSETRQAFKFHKTQTYHFDNEDDVKELESFFGVEDGTPTYVEGMIHMLTGIKLNGGSVIKAILLGNNYCDRYWDRTTKKPKTHVMSATLKTITVVASAVGVVLALL